MLPADLTQAPDRDALPDQDVLPAQAVESRCVSLKTYRNKRRRCMTLSDDSLNDSPG